MLDGVIDETPQFWRQAFRDAPTATCITDEDGRFVFVNRAYCRLYGWSEAELLGQEFTIVVPPAFHEPARAMHRAFIEHGDEPVMEWRVIRKDGRGIDILAQASRIAPAPGRWWKVTAVTDITHQKLEERRFRTLLVDAVPVMLWYMDRDRVFHSANDAYCRFHGRPREEVIGRRFEDVVPEIYWPRVLPMLDRAFAGEDVRYVVDGVALPDGKRGAMDIAYTAHHGADGGIIGLFGTIRDVTRMKETEAALARARDEAERANRAKSDFLARMSHELRTPLNAILGFAEVIGGEIMGPVGTACYRDYARDIHASGEHLLELINDILDLSKIEAGKLDLSREWVRPYPLLEACIPFVASRAAKAGTALRFQASELLRPVFADRRALKQVVINLLGNAVKFTPAGGTVTLSAVEDENALLITIADTGCGMDEEEVAVALAPFGQVGGHGPEGTGLGLPITKALVELHGGTLGVASRKGEGTAITVSLPAGRAPAA